MICSVWFSLSSNLGLPHSHKSGNPPFSAITASRRSLFTSGHFFGAGFSACVALVVLPLGFQAEEILVRTASSISFRETLRPQSRVRSSSRAMIPTAGRCACNCRATRKSQLWTPSPACGGAASISTTKGGSGFIVRPPFWGRHSSSHHHHQRPRVVLPSRVRCRASIGTCTPLSLRFPDEMRSSWRRHPAVRVLVVMNLGAQKFGTGSRPRKEESMPTMIVRRNRFFASMNLNLYVPPP